MTGTPVSVIVPCYNAARFLAATLDSILAQDHRPMDVVVVDDGSTDDTAEIAGGFAGVRCVRQANAGVCAARNTGVRETAGEFVVFMDADDLMLGGCLETGVRELSARPECAMVYGVAQDITADGRVIGASPPRDRSGERPAGYASLLEGRGITPPGTAIFRRSAVQAVGGFEVGRKLAEDHEFYLRVARRFPIHEHGALVVQYRQHDHNASRQSTARLLNAVIRAIDEQGEWVRGKPELEEAARRGRRHWRGLFGPQLTGETIMCLKRGRWKPAGESLLAALRQYPQGIPRHFVRRAAQRLGLAK